MERCPDENKIAQYIDWEMGYGLPPSEIVRDHIAKCLSCKELIVDVVDGLNECEKAEM